MEKKTTDHESPAARKVPALLRRSGFFFGLLFLLWMGLVFLLNASHAYFSAPLPNQIRTLQTEPAGAVGQGQPPQR